MLLSGYVDNGTEEEDWMDTTWADPHNTETGYSLFEGSSSTRYTNTDVEDGSVAALPTSHASAENMGNECKQEATVTRMLLNDNKAGMEGLDKSRINQIIYEASKGSRYFESERKKEEQMRKRIEEQKYRLEKLTEFDLNQGICEADKLLDVLKKDLHLGHTIVHIDMDAFYAAVEMRDRPDLKNKPMAVGGNSMLSTSNYHARKFGVRAAMPGFIGKKLCPDLVIVPTNFHKYTEVSKQVRELMSEYDPNFCPMSLDEAYLDITQYLLQRQKLTEAERTFICRKKDSITSKCTDTCNCDLNMVLKDRITAYCLAPDHDQPSTITDQDQHCGVAGKKIVGDRHLTEEGFISTTGKCGNQNYERIECNGRCSECGKLLPEYEFITFGLGAEDVVHELRCRIEQKTRLTASAGIAPNTLLAKVCSDKNKPNGQYIIPATSTAVRDFIRDLPIRKISGIGKVSEQMLSALGVVSCHDLYKKRALLYHLYSSTSFNYFMRISLGIGSTTVERDGEKKSISTERTFQELSKPADLYQKCHELCEALVDDLKKEDMMGKTVTLKIKTVTFQVKTKAQSLSSHTCDMKSISGVACELLKNEIQSCFPSPLKLRLMGVRMSNLLLQKDCRKQKQHTLTGFVQRSAHGQKTQNKLVEMDSSINGDRLQPNHVTFDVEQSDEPNETKQSVFNLIQQNNEDGDKCNSVGFTETSLNESERWLSGTCSKEFTDRTKVYNASEEGICRHAHENLSAVENFGQKCCETVSNPDKTNAASVRDNPLSKHKGNTVTYSREKLVEFCCPICKQQLHMKNLMKINKHVDMCLLENSKDEVNNFGVSSRTNNSSSVANINQTQPVSHTENSTVSGSSGGTSRIHKSTGTIQSEPVVPHNIDAVHGKTSPGSEIAVTSPVCPICHIEQTGCTLSAFNGHVDSCLSKGTIKEILKEQSSVGRINLKRPSDVKQQSATKKKKLNRADMKHEKNSIISFFKR